MFIINHRKIFFTLSGLLILGSIVAVIVFGFHLGIDFKGGSVYEVSYPYGRPVLEATQEKLDALHLGFYSLTPSGDANYILKTKDITPDEKTVILQTLSNTGG